MFSSVNESVFDVRFVVSRTLSRLTEKAFDPCTGALPIIPVASAKSLAAPEKVRRFSLPVIKDSIKSACLSEVTPITEAFIVCSARRLRAAAKSVNFPPFQLNFIVLSFTPYS